MPIQLFQNIQSTLFESSSNATTFPCTSFEFMYTRCECDSKNCIRNVISTSTSIYLAKKFTESFFYLSSFFCLCYPIFKKREEYCSILRTTWRWLNTFGGPGASKEASQIFQMVRQFCFVHEMNNDEISNSWKKCLKYTTMI